MGRDPDFLQQERRGFILLLMRIAMIFRRLNVKGGTQRQGLSLARALKEKGHEVTLFAIHYNSEQCYPDLLSGFNVVTIPKEERENAKNAPYYASVYSRNPLVEIRNENYQAKKLAEVMNGEFDVLNPHDQVAYKVAYYYKKTRARSKTLQMRGVEERKTKPYSSYGEILSDEGNKADEGFWTRSKKNIPIVWNMNDLPLRRYGYDRTRACDDNFHQPIWKIFIYWLIDTYEKYAFISKMDAIAVVDFFNRDLVRKYLGLKAFTVRSGPDFDHFEFKEKQPPLNNKIKMLTSGILMVHRRFEDSIRALPLLVKNGIDATLTIMGDTDNDKKYYSRLQKIVSDLKLESRVKFLGRVSEANLIKSYHENDVYVFQHHMQSDGLSPFEAAACGMPIVVSKTAGCHEVLRDREDALLIEPKNPEDISKKITELVKNPDLYKKMAKNANAFVRANFSWPKYADGILNVMKEVKEKGSQINHKT